MRTKTPRSSSPKFWAYVLNEAWVEIRHSPTQPRFRVSVASMTGKQGKPYRLKVCSLVGGTRIVAMNRWQVYRKLTNPATVGGFEVGSLWELDATEAKKLGLKP